MADAKERRISLKDWQQVETYVKKELDKRKNDSFRKLHETVWREVDRQIYMKPMDKIRYNESGTDWHSAIELGELAKASEMITADAMRLAFPDNRAWFESHVELPPELDQNTGDNVGPSQEDQVYADGVLRAFMAQQHIDFGLKERIRLSVKETLHHGSFVAEARSESAMMVDNTGGIGSIAAPVWVPHSMWNSYPDPSPSIIGANMLYTGSMILIEYAPRWKVEEAAKRGIKEGWMQAQVKKVPKRSNKNKDIETEDLELVKYFGDLVIKRDDGDIFLPNSKIILANDVIVFYAPNRYPFPNIIYNGYEKLDVRDPYYTSPLIKLSPMHKVASVLANKYLDSLSLRVEPPVLYDGNDPAFIQSGGPQIVPGWKGPTKGRAEWKILEVGDPNFALNGLTLILDQIKQGTAADANRTFGETGDETATGVKARMARAEVRVVDFVDKLEFSLKTFLYMQHEINKIEIPQYSFYNPEMDAPDFMRITREEIPQTAHFDVVGSRGVLGEEERAQKASVVTAFAAGNPMFAPLLKPVEILKEMYQDAGVKNPERFLNVPNDQMQQIEEFIRAQYEEQMQQHEEMIRDLKEKLAIRDAVNAAKVTEAEIKANIQANISSLKAHVQAQLDIIKTSLKVDESELKQQQMMEQLMGQIAEMELKLVNEVEAKDKESIRKDESDRKEDERMKALTEAINGMNEAIKKMSKPKKIIRDAKGSPVSLVTED